MQKALFPEVAAPPPRKPHEGLFPLGWDTVHLPSGLEFATGKGVAYARYKGLPMSRMSSADRDALVKSATIHMPKHTALFPEDVSPFEVGLDDTLLIGFAGEFKYLNIIVHALPPGKKLALAFVPSLKFGDEEVVGGPWWYFSESGLARWTAAFGLRPLGPPGAFGQPHVRMYLRPSDD